MNPPPENDPLHAAISARLAEMVADSPTAPAWREAWLRLGPDTSEEERLRIYQAIRRSGSLPDEAGFYLVAWQADALASLQAETELRELDEQLEEIEAAHGRDEFGDWPAGAAPAEYQALMERYHEEWDSLFLGVLREFGEAEMARLCETDRERFEQLSKAGQEYFYGPADPEWLEELLDGVVGSMQADAPMGPLGVRYREEDGFWEICVYPRPVELVGGAADGAVVDPGFSLDLLQLQSLFEELVDVTWSTQGAFDGEPPYIALEGVFKERTIFLQILSAAPDDEEPGMKFKVSG